MVEIEIERSGTEFRWDPVQHLSDQDKPVSTARLGRRTQKLLTKDVFFTPRPEIVSVQPVPAVLSSDPHNASSAWHLLRKQISDLRAPLSRGAKSPDGKKEEAEKEDVPFVEARKETYERFKSRFCISGAWPGCASKDGKGDT